MPSTIGKCKLFRIKHITLLEGETFLRNKPEIAFFEIKCTFFGRKENTIKGNARNLIGEECTIKDIINKLKLTVKGESVEVLFAKIMNIRQNNKTANTYCSEIENFTKSLENAYI